MLDTLVSSVSLASPMSIRKSKRKLMFSNIPQKVKRRKGNELLALYGVSIFLGPPPREDTGGEKTSGGALFDRQFSGFKSPAKAAHEVLEVSLIRKR